MKQKVLNLIQWISFLVTMLTVVLGSMYVGAIVCGWLREALNLTGFWILLLVPVMVGVSFAILIFFMQGTKKMEPYKTWEERH